MDDPQQQGAGEEHTHGGEGTGEHAGHDPYAGYGEEAGDEYTDEGAHAEAPAQWETVPLGESFDGRFPTVVIAIVALGFTVIALARLDATWVTLDFENALRPSIRSLASEIGFLLVSGGLLVGGATATRLSGGAKAALVAVGGILLLAGGDPFGLFGL